MGACAPLSIVPTVPRASNTEAILILPGLGMRAGAKRNVRAFADSASNEGFDLFLADYRSRSSIDAGVESLRGFVTKHHLDRYERVHVFAFIMGGYTLNRYLEQYPMPNLGNVVYDRSPLQELAPRLATTGWFKVPAWVAVGPVLADLARTPYRPVGLGDEHRIGLIIENRATRFIRKRRKRALALRPLTFEPDSLGQPYDDAIHVPFNHDEMYTSFDVVGPELIRFLRFGEFSDQAARRPLGIDPFSKN
jgi:pimeloyl-ACP methyl ester carboxylesterase